MQTPPADSRLRTLLWISAAIRLLLICWGEVQDHLLTVKYTDIDYVVFTDAARFVAQGGSPFERSTYRYSPLLAYLLLPNIWVHGAWGKLLFSAGDILAAVMITRLLRRLHTPEPTITLAAMAWLYNPYTLTISTRGSCDVLAALLLLAMLQLLLAGRTLWAAVAYGLVVHLRIYPIIFAPALVFFLARRQLGLQTPTLISKRPSTQEHSTQQQRQQLGGCSTPLDANSSAGAAPARASLWTYPPSAWLPQLLSQGVIFGVTSGGIFLLLSATFYRLYGQQFLQEAFLHHLTRKDPRHNFSPHFYPTYLKAYSHSAWPAAGSQTTTPSASLFEALHWATGATVPLNMAQYLRDAAAMPSSGNDTAVLFSTALPLSVPSSQMPWMPDVAAWSSCLQLGLQLVLAATLHWDLPACLLLQTMAFVALNKVCTAQYFVWYFSLLPLVLPRIPWPPPRGLTLALAAWVALQLHWLLWGYLLEFQGLPVHLALWSASILFLGANVYLMVQLHSMISCLYVACTAARLTFLEACLPAGG